jgi:Fic family protein
MKNKKYPTTDSDWIKYLTIDNYYTDNEISYREPKIKEMGCNFDYIKQKVSTIRQSLKSQIFTYSDKEFYIVETIQLKSKIEELKYFFKNQEYNQKDRFSEELLFDTLIEESFSSSTIEGAYSTKARSRELIQNKEEPKDISETMIFNNFLALETIKSLDVNINKEFILSVHKIVTNNTLENKEDEGSFRKDSVDIIDDKQKIVYQAPDYKVALDMLSQLLDFLKENEFEKPIDNIYKSIAFHFIFSFIHPFMDGNGRTVRVLFTKLLQLYGYDMFYYISISEVINKNKKLYYKAFLDTERSDNNSNNSFDMTYFFYYIADTMLDGLKELKRRVNTYYREDFMEYIIKEAKLDLTPRQKKIISLLSDKDKSFMLTTRDFADFFKKAERTIQKDLKLLIDFGLVVRVPSNRKKYFRLNIKI